MDNGHSFLWGREGGEINVSNVQSMICKALSEKSNKVKMPKQSMCNFWTMLKNLEFVEGSRECSYEQKIIWS